MGWPGHLTLHYRRDGERTTAHDRHHGPLRVLQRLYPEGERICHHVLVHPPGGLVGGDVLDVEVRLDEGSHALVTTPGATRYYRSDAAAAQQRVQVTVASGARLDWLPLESIAYDQCRGVNRQTFDLAPGAEMFGWDLLALGLPAGGTRWAHGEFEQRIEMPGIWLEQARLRADDHALLRSPLGWNDQRVLGTLWFRAGAPLSQSGAEDMLELVRSLLDSAPASVIAGATWQHPTLIVVRALGPRVEPVFELFTRLWSRWRAQAWQLPESVPRIWRM